MNSQQTENSQEKKQQLQSWIPDSIEGEATFSKQVSKEKEVIDEISPTSNVAKASENSIGSETTVQTENSNNTAYNQQTEATQSTAPKRISGKQRKESLEEYRGTFLQVPKLDDRKPVFVSREVRDKLDEIVRKLGRRKMSVSGFIENLALHHLEAYHDDFEVWRKL